MPCAWHAGMWMPLANLSSRRMRNPPSMPPNSLVLVLWMLWMSPPLLVTSPLASSFHLYHALFFTLKGKRRGLFLLLRCQFSIPQLIKWAKPWLKIKTCHHFNRCNVLEYWIQIKVEKKRDHFSLILTIQTKKEKNVELER